MLRIKTQKKNCEEGSSSAGAVENNLDFLAGSTGSVHGITSVLVGVCSTFGMFCPSHLVQDIPAGNRSSSGNL